MTVTKSRSVQVHVTSSLSFNTMTDKTIHVLGCFKKSALLEYLHSRKIKARTRLSFIAKCQMYEPVFVNTCEHLSVEPYAFITKIIKKHSELYDMSFILHDRCIQKKCIHRCL